MAFRTALRWSLVLAAGALVGAVGVGSLPSAAAGASAPAPAPAAGGAWGHSGRVMAQDREIFEIECAGGQTASVQVVGDGDTDLDVYIFDQFGSQVTADTDTTDWCVVTWTPSYTARYTVEVRNLGSVYNAFVLAMK